MSHDLQLLVTGAGISLISSIFSLIMQHLLSLRLDKVKRERDKIDKEILDLKQRLYKDVDLETIKKLRNTFYAFDDNSGTVDEIDILVTSIAQELIKRKTKEITEQSQNG